MKVQGLKQLKRKLANLEKKAATRAVRKAIRAGTVIVAKAVKAATPVDRGGLKEAQTFKVKNRKVRGYGVVGADVGKLDRKEASGEGVMPSNLDWLVEFGHTAPDGTVTPPSGYHRRAEASALPQAEQAIIDKLRTEIEREATR